MRRICIVMALLLAAVRASAAGPASATNALEFTIRRAANAPKGADTGSVFLWPNGFSATNAAVRVLAGDGSEAGHMILWAAEGEPLRILFDCSSGGNAYRLFVQPGQTEPARAKWHAASGLILETRKRAEGAADTWQDIRSLCATSSPVLGRSLAPNIFLGIHPHGPTRDFVSIFHGVFTADKPGAYGFATMSEGPSCLLVDGAMVAGWPGRHDVRGGRRAQHRGSVKLTAGRHRIEYLNVTEGSAFTAAAAWKRPDSGLFEIMPAAAFPPVARFDMAVPDPAGNAPPARPLMAWEIKEHFMANDLAMVAMEFRVLNGNDRREWRWSFDDGARETGAVVNHLFLSPGLRMVKLELVEKGKATASIEQKVAVHPLWSQEKDSPKDIFRDQRRTFLTGHAARAPVNDLINVYRIMDAVGNAKLAGRAATLAAGRREEFRPDNAQGLYDLAFFFQRPSVKQYGQAENAFRGVIEMDGREPRLREMARLHLAGLLLHMLDRVDDARVHLQAVDAGRLSNTDRRLQAIYGADLLLAEG
ncbi:MAG: hypothetical protein JW951_00295, partial [Lentisphaerae bacterium]|nr:hypothetical protein [Lentisphaerota bacterium]